MTLSSFKHFRILQLLGKGGMGEVYLALDTTLERKVALKFLPRDLLRDPSAQGRLLDEARSVSRVQHPNIAVVHSIEEDGGIFAICMEYVEGATLKQLLRKGPVPLNQIVRIGAETAAGMQAAHDMGIVHRDLKPANIMITRRGQVKIMDFGLALRPERVVNTMGPNTYGTVQYMSPEQARGERLTPSSDIFSFGSTFYELIAGRPPFDGANDLAILQAIINSDPKPLREHRRDVPPALEQIVRGCMAKAPISRWESMAQIAAEYRYVEPTVEAGPRDLISELSTGLAEAPPKLHHAPANLGRVGRRNAAPNPPSGTSAPSVVPGNPGLRELGIDLPEEFVVCEVRDKSGPASAPASAPRSGSAGSRGSTRSSRRGPITVDRTGEFAATPTGSRPPSVLGPELPIGPTHSRELVVQTTAEQWGDVARGSGSSQGHERDRAIAREAARRAQLSKPVRPIGAGASGPSGRARAQASPFRDLQDEADHFVALGRRGRIDVKGSRWTSALLPLIVALLIVAVAGYVFFKRIGVEPPLPKVPSLHRAADAPSDATTAADPGPVAPDPAPPSGRASAVDGSSLPTSAAFDAVVDSNSTRGGAASAVDSAKAFIGRLLRQGE